MCSRIWKRGLGAVWIALAPACGFLSPPALAQCATSGNNQVCTNPFGTTIPKIFDSGTSTVTNLGTISPGGITGPGVNLTNAGTVQGASVAIDVSTIHLLNLAGGTVTGTNVGTEFENGTIVNNGTISGGIAVAVSGNAVIVNSGSIISLGGPGGTAIDLSGTTGANHITLNTGSNIQGTLVLPTANGVSTSLNVTGGNASLAMVATTLASNTLQHATLNCIWAAASNGCPAIAPPVVVDAANAGLAPFGSVVLRSVTVDPTPFAHATTEVMGFVQGVTSMISNDNTSYQAIYSEGVRIRGAVAYAPAEDGVQTRINDAFASIPALAYASEAAPFRNVTTVTSDGRSVWARGFSGTRVYQGDPANGIQHASSNFGGGGLGADLVARPGLVLGVFVGSGISNFAVDFNLEKLRTETVFGGFYGNYGFGSFGLDSFVNFSLHGGASTIRNQRILNNNLAPNGIESATASTTASM